jgi:YVTN family beta-propeller protein
MGLRCRAVAVICLLAGCEMPHSAAPVRVEPSKGSAPAASVPGKLDPPVPVAASTCLLDQASGLAATLLPDQLPADFPTSQPSRTLPADTPATENCADGHAIQACTLPGGPLRLYVADEANGQLVVLDPLTLEVLGQVAVGNRPSQVAIVDGQAWVTLRGDVRMARVTLPALTVERVPVGVEPLALAVRPDLVLVGLGAAREVVALAPATGQILWHAAVAGRPVGLSLAGSTLDVVLEGGGAARLQIPADPTHAPVAQPVSLRTRNPAHLLAEGLGQVLPSLRSSHGVALGHDLQGNPLVAHVLANPGEVGLLGLGLALAAGGYGTTTTPGGDLDACHALPVRPLEVTVTRLSPDGPRTQALAPVRDPLNGRQFLARFDQPSDLRVATAAGLAVVAMRGTDNALVLDLAADDPMAAPVAELRAGAGPSGVAMDAAGLHAWILNGQDLSVSRMDLQPLHDVAQAGPVLLPAPMTLDPTVTHAFATDPLPEGLRHGRRIFTSATTTGLSLAGRFACASCHFEGRDDGLVWAVPQGPRQTPALAGRLIDTAPYGWRGEEPTLADHVAVAVERLGGTGLSQRDAADLQAWLVQGLALPQPVVVDLASVRRGASLFHAPTVGCAGCHGGKGMTDGANHDVGTASLAEKLSGEEDALVFNTPSLRGLALTAPYLHDGSAATLEQVLDRTANTMGHAGSLQPGQRADLIAYLRSL